MPRKNTLNITDICRRFRERSYGAEHVDLFNALRKDCIHNREWKLALAAIMNECVAQSKQPMDAMGLALLYGMELGVLLERERRSREVLGGGPDWSKVPEQDA